MSDDSTQSEATAPPKPPPPNVLANGLSHATTGQLRLSDKDFTEIGAAFKSRHTAGWILGALGFLFVGVAIFSAERSIERAFDKLSTVHSEGFGAPTERLLFAIFAVQAIVSVAAVYFGYSMLRVAERLFVPRHLLIDKQDAEVLRTIVGIDTPAKAATDQIKNTAGEIGAVISAVAKPMADVIKTVTDKSK